MRAILSLRRHHYLKTVGIFLIAVALIAGVVSCNGGATYKLTMAVAPAGSGMATDETNTSPYAKDTVVDIKAVANPGYEFVNWSAPAGKFDDENAAETTFEMPGRDVTVTANFVEVYELTMAVNPAGGGTTTPTGTNPYPEGTEVDIEAVATPPYQFVKWTATAGTLDDENEEETIFTMPDEDVTVTANFVGPLDHFKCYEAEDILMEPIDEVVYLEDQFGAFNVTVGEAGAFCNPAEKMHDEEPTPIFNPDHHFTIYGINVPEENYVIRSVKVSNQFAPEQELWVFGPYGLAVPTQKVEPGGHEEPVGLDHYLLYGVEGGPGVYEYVTLTDQFDAAPQEAFVYSPVIFATPVRKTHGENVTEITTDEHLVFYEIGIEAEESYTQVQVVNQFGEGSLNVSAPAVLLAVPSEKIVPPVPPLDHFKCYPAVGLPLEDVYVEYLVDQFGDFSSVKVDSAAGFCNPVDKVYLEEPTPSNPDNHLTMYWLSNVELQTWNVVVTNQFGDDQELRVVGPIGLAVPTQKLDPWYHPEPKYLDHFLLYYVESGTSLEDVYVDLDDEFPGSAPGVQVATPVLFANPVLVKEHGDNIAVAWNPEAHLVFYEISPNPEFCPGVMVSNQFDPGDLQYLALLDADEALAVPSEKIAWEPVTVAVLGDYDSQLTDLLLDNNIWAEERDWDVISDIGDYAVVVINEPSDPGETTFLDFLDAASDNGVGVVFTSSYSVASSWGISLLEWHLSDPAGQDMSCLDGGVYYKVTQAHPIFDGWNVDDEITIITGGFWNDHAWFWDYSGDTIADVGSDSGGIRGDAAAVGTYGGSTHVLLASLGPQGDTDMTDWTNDAKTIFINAICFAAGM